MNEPTFLDLIDRLTRPTPQVIETDDGLRKVESDGLLQMLREAVFGGLETGGGSSAFGSRMMIDAAAVDLLDLITAQATELLATVNPKPTPFGHAEDYVRAWAARTDENVLSRVTAPAVAVDGSVFREQVETTAYRHAQRWIALIEGFFNPPAQADVQAQCPNCHVDHVGKIVDGILIPVWAVILRRERSTGETIDAYCQACTMEWPRRDLRTFAEDIGIDVAAKVGEALER